jgi:8-oxo-dGTP pyrophosphatase MutT (NUDIX family)
MRNQTQIKIGVLIQKNKSLLLIKEKKNSSGKYYWNIIKGTFEPEKDKNPLETAIRECREETGVPVKIKSLLNIIFLKRKLLTTIQLNFIAFPQKDSFKIPKAADQKKRGENIIEIKFFNKKDLKKIKKQDFINKRAYLAIKDWVKGKKYSLELLKCLYKNKN